MKSRKQVFIITALLMLALLTPIFTAQAKTSNKVRLANKKITLNVGSKKKLTVKASNKNSKWKSSSRKIATVSEKGVVKAVKAGKAKITASNRYGKDVCVVSVVKKNKSNSEIKKNEVEKAVGSDPALEKQVDNVQTPVIPRTDAGNNNKKNNSEQNEVINETPAPIFDRAVHVDLSDESTMRIDEGTKVKHNADGSLTVTIDKHYQGISFFLPKEERDAYKDYKYVTIEYESTLAFCDALYDGFSIYEQETDPWAPAVIYYKENDGNRIVAAPNGNKLTFRAESGFKDDCIKGIRIINPYDTGREVGIKVKDVIFSTTKEAVGDTTLVDTPAVAADVWLYFGVDQDTITTSTTFISGTVQFKNYESKITVVVNNKVIAEKQLNAGDETFVIDLDPSEFRYGGKVVVHRAYTGEDRQDLKVWDSYKEYIIQGTESNPIQTKAPEPTATVAPRATQQPKVAEPIVHVDLSDESIMRIDEGTKVKHNDDGSLSVTIDKHYQGISFFLPKEARDCYKDYKYVTIEYESVLAFCDGLYDGYSIYEKETDPWTPAVIYYKENDGNRIVAAPNGNKLTFRAESGFKDDCIKGIRIINPYDTGREVEIKVKDVIFSTTEPSQYGGISDASGDHMPGHIRLTFKEATDIDTVYSLFDGIEVEEIEDSWKTYYDIFKDNENTNPDALEGIRSRIGIHYNIILKDKSDDTLYKVIESLNSNPLVLSAGVNAITYPV